MAPNVDAPLQHRPKEALLHIEADAPLSDPLLLDANAIGRILLGKAPPILRARLEAGDAWMAAPGASEVEHLIARLDPTKPDSARTIAKLRDMLDQVAPTHILVPDAAAWSAAARMAGTIVRRNGGPTRKVAPGERIELVNDCLTAIVTAAAGGTVVTNDLDFDLIQQLMPDLRVVFFGHAIEAGPASEGTGQATGPRI
ncbi:PIN domain-containing protein [Neoroseomonas oryzicola]|uniref:PIN domain-containing protein n=1 Tax=Neoroseomonas oryzicola TaxID=535904 RepID=A0A9X9WIP6_9PROT|nr:PIN domain-containing protein [Neoroseomonas oryzicola]MBR0660206.1 hypothetical protein [Neoroseomonas oryzicola]NKE16719.1 hypothetical protein [Neoroseomonas oryzicola]